MPTRQRIGQLLQGFGAGYRGRGMEFIQGMQDEQEQDTLQDAFAIQQHIQNNNMGGARQAILSGLKRGGDTEDLDMMLESLDQGNFDQLAQQASAVVNYGISTGKLPGLGKGGGNPAELQTFNALMGQLNDPNTLDNVRQAIRVKLGMNPRATGPQVVDIGGVAKLWNPQEQSLSGFSIDGQPITPESVGASEGTIAGATEQARLAAQLETQPEIAAETERRKDAVSTSKELFDKLAPVNKSIANMNKAINALDAGANTGKVYSMLPSVTAASVALDNVRNELGLDIVGASTFGALSESELAFALDTALPTDLKPPELKAWLKRKIDAQKKLREENFKAARYLSKSGNTIGSYLDEMAAEGKYAPATPSAPTQQNLAPGFDGLSEPEKAEYLRLKKLEEAGQL